MKMRGKSIYPIRATGLKSSVLIGFAAVAERGDLSKVGSAIEDSLEEGSVGGDSSEMGLTVLAEREGISGKRSGRGSA